MMPSLPGRWIAIVLLASGAACQGGPGYLAAGAPPRLQFRPATTEGPLVPLPPLALGEAPASATAPEPSAPDIPPVRESEPASAVAPAPPVASAPPTEPAPAVANSGPPSSAAAGVETSAGVVAAPLELLTPQVLIPYFTGPGQRVPGTTVVAPVTFVPPQIQTPLPSRATYQVIP